MLRVKDSFDENKRLMNCGQCSELQEKFGTKPACLKVPCKVAKYQHPTVELWLMFWVRLRNSVAVPAEVLLRAADCEDAQSLDLLSMLDSLYSNYNAEKAAAKTEKIY